MMSGMNTHGFGFRRQGPQVSAGVVSRLMAALRVAMIALALLVLLPAVESEDTPAVKHKAINTVCPVTGKPIDAKLAPVVVVIGKGEKAKRYTIGIAVASAADAIKGDPQKYADAAKANKKAE